MEEGGVEKNLDWGEEGKDTSHGRILYEPLQLAKIGENSTNLSGQKGDQILTSYRFGPNGGGEQAKKSIRRKSGADNKKTLIQLKCVRTLTE